MNTIIAIIIIIIIILIVCIICYSIKNNTNTNCNNFIAGMPCIGFDDEVGSCRTYNSDKLCCNYITCIPNAQCFNLDGNTCITHNLQVEGQCTN